MMISIYYSGNGVNIYLDEKVTNEEEHDKVEQDKFIAYDDNFRYEQFKDVLNMIDVPLNKNVVLNNELNEEYETMVIIDELF